MTRPWLFGAPFFGGGSDFLAVLAGLSVVAPVGYMGGKRRFMRAILAALGLTPGAGADLMIGSDAPPGVMASVWPALLHPPTARLVATELRRIGACPLCLGERFALGAPTCEACGGTRRRNPVELWHALAAEPPAAELVSGAARGLWLQGRSCSNIPIWWEPTRERWEANGHGNPVPHEAAQRDSGRWVVDGHARGARKRGEVITRGATTKLPGRWVVADGGTGRVHEAGTVHGAKDAVQRGKQRGSSSAGLKDPATIARRCEAIAVHVARALALQAGNAQARPIAIREGAWLLNGYAHLSDSARDRGFEDRLRCDLIAGRLEGIIGAVQAQLDSERFSGLLFYAGDFANIIPPGDLTGSVWVFDPPYEGKTAYAADAPRWRVVQAAIDVWRRGGRVAYCEAEPIPELVALGWHTLEITRRVDRGAPTTFKASSAEWLTLSHPPVEVLPEVPEQLSLLEAS